MYKYIQVKADYEQNKYIQDACSKQVALLRYRYSGENHSTQGGVHRMTIHVRHYLQQP